MGVVSVCVVLHHESNIGHNEQSLNFFIVSNTSKVSLVMFLTGVCGVALGSHLGPLFFYLFFVLLFMLQTKNARVTSCPV